MNNDEWMNVTNGSSLVYSEIFKEHIELNGRNT